MKIDIISDIHLDHYKKINYADIISNTEKADILILAGDIGNPYNDIYKQFLKYVSNEYNNVILITGNHEYYQGCPIKEVDEYIIELTKDLKNIYFLNNKNIVIDNVNFIGTTLWLELVRGKEYFISDVRKICPYNKNDLGTINDFRGLFYNNIKFIEDSIQKDMINIVITHHLPSFKLIHEKYNKFNHLSEWFASDCEYTMENNPEIKYWICGHSHAYMDIMIHKTNVIMNPYGYPNENTEFSKKIIDLNL